MTTTRLGVGAVIFDVEVKRGTARDIQFTIVGEVDLVGHDWSCVLRGAGGRRVDALSVSRAVVTVDAVDDSIEVTIGISADLSAQLRSGAAYIFDCEDTTTNVVWAAGKVRILRNTLLS